LHSDLLADEKHCSHLTNKTKSGVTKILKPFRKSCTTFTKAWNKRKADNKVAARVKQEDTWQT